MQIDIELLCKAEIERANRNGELIGRNPDAGRLIDFIATGDGFWGHRQVKGISSMLYVDEPRTPQKNSPSRTQPSRGNSGDLRWDNLRQGRASFHEREATFMHSALVNGFGTEWGRAFPCEELALMSFHEFLTKALTLNLPWPDGKISPAIAMEVIWVSQMGEALTIRPADPIASRLGGNFKSENRQLQSTCSLPKHEPQEKYHLQVRGIKPGVERLFVFEASQEDMAFEGGNETFCGFPVRLVKPESANITIKADENGSFEFYDIKGGFAFFAVAFPEEWEFQKVFDADPNVERWSRDEFESFIRSIRRLQHEKSGEVRLGWYGYKVV